LFIYTKLIFNEYFWYGVLTDVNLDINWDQISRAADGMISNHGKDALAEAYRRAQTLRSAGCYTAAMTWESICELIQGRIDGYALVGSTVAPKLSQTEMPGRATLKASFFETL
jgi:hypothetical protein